MNRRHILATAGFSSSLLIAGCTSSLYRCPQPDIEDEVAYENRLVEDPRHYGRAEDTVLLLTSSGQVDKNIARTLDQDAKEFVSETDFNEYVVVIIQVTTSSDSSDLIVLGAERGNSTVRVYTCIADEGITDDLHPHTQVVRIAHEEQIPEDVAVTHFMEDTQHEVESNQ